MNGLVGFSSEKNMHLPLCARAVSFFLSSFLSFFLCTRDSFLVWGFKRSEFSSLLSFVRLQLRRAGAVLPAHATRNFFFGRVRFSGRFFPSLSCSSRKEMAHPFSGQLQRCKREKRKEKEKRFPCPATGPHEGLPVLCSDRRPPDRRGQKPLGGLRKFVSYRRLSRQGRAREFFGLFLLRFADSFVSPSFS